MPSHVQALEQLKQRMSGLNQPVDEPTLKWYLRDRYAFCDPFFLPITSPACFLAMPKHCEGQAWAFKSVTRQAAIGLPAQERGRACA